MDNRHQSAAAPVAEPVAIVQRHAGGKVGKGKAGKRRKEAHVLFLNLSIRLGNRCLYISQRLNNSLQRKAQHWHLRNICEAVLGVAVAEQVPRGPPLVRVGAPVGHLRHEAGA